ncbi:hypothetical protein F5B19DRAFT_501169 [Rostrohypoxylon terebratum]|nr:hypothetical protein F5B19DRAFT_501169 [Rostrohypoxylon terebratum]
MDASDVPETQQESQSSASETVVSSGDTKPHGYQIPEWFLKGNIMAPADLTHFKSRAHLSDSNSPEETTADDSALFEVSPRTFSGLRDLIFASFVRNADGSLPAELPTVSFRAKPTGKYAYGNDVLDDIVMRVAKDIGAILISMNLEDLEDLSCELKHQDEKHPRVPLSEDSESSSEEKTEVQQYFAVDSETNASKCAWSRVNRAISAIVDAARVAAMPTSDGMSQNPLTIVNLRDVSRIVNWTDPGNFKTLARFRDFVQERRKLGENIVMLTTSPELSTWRKEEEEASRITRESGISAESCLICKPRIREGIITLGNVSQWISSYPAAINTRRLKRLLREKLVNGDSIDFLQVYSDWGKLGVSCGGAEWSREITKLAALQARGRTFKKPDLDLDDIESVLRQLDLCKDPSNFMALEDDNDSILDESEKLKRWEERKDLLSKGCNEYEKRLLGCVVNPGKFKISQILMSCLVLGR